MIGRLAKNCRPVLDAFEKELSTDRGDVPVRLSIDGRCFVKVRLDEASTWQRVAQHLDKSSTGNLIAVLAIVGELKGQIAGGRQALPEGSGGHFTVSVQFHDPYNRSEERRVGKEGRSRW